MTLEQFIEREIVVWGEDYIYDLIDQGYTPVLTDRGWKWVYDVDAHEFQKIQVDAGASLC